MTESFQVILNISWNKSFNLVAIKYNNIETGNTEKQAGNSDFIALLFIGVQKQIIKIKAFVSIDRKINIYAKKVGPL